MPRWKAGIKDGIPVKVYRMLPITFKLLEDTATQIVYTYVDKMPEPEYDFEKYINMKLVYPESAAKEDIEGTVLIKFIVNETGSISNCEVIRGVGGGCDEEALLLVKNMPRWKPAEIKGKTVRAYNNVSIRFKFPEGKFKPVPASGIYTNVEVKPEPGYDLTAYLKKHVQYPDSARNNNIAGEVVIQFVVNEDGTISDCHVIKGIGGGCDEMALNAIKNMPDWKSGRQNGKKVKVYCKKSMTFGAINRQPAFLR